MASFLRRLCDLNCRASNAISVRVRTCHLAIQNVSPDDADKTHQHLLHKVPSKQKEIEHKHGFSPHKTVLNRDLSKDLEFAHKLFCCLTNIKPQAVPKKKLDKTLECCSFETDGTSKGIFDESIYLWCSGVLTLSGIIFSHQWQRKSINTKESNFKLSPSLQRILKDYFWGLPRDHLILSVNAKPAGGKIQAKEDTTKENKKEENDKEKEVHQDHFAEAAAKFENTREESVLEVLNTLGIYLSKSGQEEKGLELFQQAATHGDATALYNVGLCYEHGRGTNPSTAKATKFYSIASEKGHPKAMYNLATIYMKDKKSPEKKNESISLMESAAQNDILEAQRFLGLHFAKRKDWKKALHYFTMAAEKKDPVAMYHCGICYERGLSVNSDLCKAGNYYLEAAKAGHKNSQFNIGVFYETGLGGFRKDAGQAMVWYSKASEHGDKGAKERLEILRENSRKQRRNAQPRKSVISLAPLQQWELFRGGFHKSWSSPELLSEKMEISSQRVSLDTVRRYDQLAAKPVL